MKIYKHVAVMAALATSLSMMACGSDDDDDSGAGGSSGSGAGLGGLLGKLGGGTGSNTTGGGSTGGGNTGGGSTGGGDTGGGNTGGGDISNGGGEGLSCLTACGMVLNCVNQACGTDLTQAECEGECAGNNESIPISPDTGCDQLATALEIDNFQSICGDVSGGGDTGGGDTGGGSAGGGGGDCCEAIGCVASCAQDPTCIQSCVADACGEDGAACAQCDAWAQANQEEAAECAGFSAGGGGA